MKLFLPPQTIMLSVAGADYRDLRRRWQSEYNERCMGRHRLQQSAVRQRVASRGNAQLSQHQILQGLYRQFPFRQICKGGGLCGNGLRERTQEVSGKLAFPQ